jgi:hypothetical protein
MVRDVVTTSAQRGAWAVMEPLFAELTTPRTPC